MILEESETRSITNRKRLVIFALLLILTGLVCLIIGTKFLFASIPSNVVNSTPVINQGIQFYLFSIITLLTVGGLIWLGIKRAYSLVAWSMLCIALHLLLGTLTWKATNQWLIPFYFPNGLWEPLNAILDATLVTFWGWSLWGSFTLKAVKEKQIGQLILFNWYVPWGMNIPSGLVCTLLPFKFLSKVETKSALTVTEYMAEKGAGVPIQAGSKDEEFQAIFEVMFERKVNNTRLAFLRPATVPTLRLIIKTAITTAVTKPESEYKTVDDLRKNKAKIAQEAVDTADNPEAAHAPVAESKAMPKFDDFGEDLVSITVIEAESNPEVLKGRVSIEQAKLQEEAENIDMDSLRKRIKQLMDDSAAAGSPMPYETALRAAQVQEKKRKAEDVNISGRGSRRSIIRNDID